MVLVVSSWTENESCSGEEKLWYGESELATYSSDAGDWSGDFPVSNMFDNNADSLWHSDDLTRTKTITIDFKVRSFIYHFNISSSFKEPIYFKRLTIQKRLECCRERYLNVCLVFDTDNDNALCTG